MNFGTSLNGRQAKSEGRAPASTVAKWIAGGITVAWIVEHVDPSEWHHAGANLGGDGRPVDYYDRAEVIAAWLVSNFAVRHENKAAMKRLPKLFALSREWDARDQSTPEPKPLPSKAAAPAVELLGTIDLTKREYTRRQRAYRAVEVTIRVQGAEWRGEWLVWSTGRCKRGSVVSIHPVSVEEERQELLRRWWSEVEAHLVSQAAEQHRREKNRRDLENLTAAYRRQPTEGRRNELSRRFKLTEQQIAEMS